MAPRSRLYGGLFLGVLSVSWAAIFIRLAAAPALSVAAWRLGLASIPVAAAALALRRRELLALRARERLLLVGAGFSLALHFGTWIASLRLTTVASSVALVTTQPVWVVLLSTVALHPGRTLDVHRAGGAHSRRGARAAARRGWSGGARGSAPRGGRRAARRVRAHERRRFRPPRSAFDRLPRAAYRRASCVRKLRIARTWRRAGRRAGRFQQALLGPREMSSGTRQFPSEDGSINHFLPPPPVPGRPGAPLSRAQRSFPSRATANRRLSGAPKRSTSWTSRPAAWLNSAWRRRSRRSGRLRARRVPRAMSMSLSGRNLPVAAEPNRIASWKSGSPARAPAILRRSAPIGGARVRAAALIGSKN